MKRNFKKLREEYFAYTQNNNVCTITIEDLGKIVEMASEIKLDDEPFIIKTHPRIIAMYGFQIGYAVALRHVKSMEKKKRQNIQKASSLVTE